MAHRLRLLLSSARPSSARTGVRLGVHTTSSSSEGGRAAARPRGGWPGPACGPSCSMRPSFPRVKICAGWVTPEALADVEVDPEKYPLTIQPFTACGLGFEGEMPRDALGAAGQLRHRPPRVRPPPPRPCGRAAGADVREGARVTAVTATATASASRPSGASSGSGRHRRGRTSLPGRARHSARCPSARRSSSPRRARRGSPPTASPRSARFTDAPELYVEPDLKGYGWYFPKDDVLNIGIGCTGAAAAPAAAPRRAGRRAARLRASPARPADRAVPRPRLRRAPAGAAAPGRAAASVWSATPPASPVT